MSEPDASSPFLRVPSRSSKWSTLIVNAFLAVLSIGALFFALHADLTNPMTWVSAYGGLFFSMGAVHSWRSIVHRWNIQEDNRHFNGPSLAWLTSKWLFSLLVLAWLAARYWP